MKTILALFAIAPFWFAAACSNPSQEARRQESGAALVTGTVVDAATGERVEGVRIDGPHDTHCVSGTGGRFELGGLHVGDEGELAARTNDGRKGHLTLRPLREGTLEVVVSLSRP